MRDFSSVFEFLNQMIWVELPNTWVVIVDCLDESMKLLIITWFCIRCTI